MKFAGRLTDVKQVKEHSKGKSIHFELTEDGVQYPNVALFSMYKPDEYEHVVDQFTEKHPIGTMIEVEFNMKRNDWDKNGEIVPIYSNQVWKFSKIEEDF